MFHKYYALLLVITKSDRGIKCSSNIPEKLCLVGVGLQNGILVLHRPSLQDRDALPSLEYRRPGGPSHRK